MAAELALAVVDAANVPLMMLWEIRVDNTAAAVAARPLVVALTHLTLVAAAPPELSSLKNISLHNPQIERLPDDLDIEVVGQAFRLWRFLVLRGAERLQPLGSR